MQSPGHQHPAVQELPGIVASVWTYHIIFYCLFVTGHPAESLLNFLSGSGNVEFELFCIDIWKIMDRINWFIENGSVMITI